MLQYLVVILLQCMQMTQAQVHFNKPIIKDKCLTPTGDVGQCIPLQDCAPLVQLLQTDEQGRRDVRRHYCHTNDNVRKVCCKIENSLIQLLSTTNTSIKPDFTPNTISTVAAAPTITTAATTNPTIPTITNATAATTTTAPPPTTAVSFPSVIGESQNAGVQPKPRLPSEETFSIDFFTDDQPLLPTTSENAAPITTTTRVSITTTPVDSTNDLDPLPTTTVDFSALPSGEATSNSSITSILPTTSSYPSHTRNISAFHRPSPSTLRTGTELEDPATSPTPSTVPLETTSTNQENVTETEMEDNGEWSVIEEIDTRQGVTKIRTLETELKLLPWIVAIWFGEINDRDSICTGTLISNRHVLTLVRCLSEQQNKSNISSLTFGSSDSPLIVNCSSPECSSIKEISNHLLDNRNGFTDGIALITLTDPVAVSDEVRALYLPDLSQEEGTDLSVYQHIVTVGWTDMTSGSYFFRTPIPPSACTEWREGAREGVHLCTIPTFQSTVISPCLPGAGKGAPLLGWSSSQQTFLLLGILQREKDVCAGTRQTVYLDISPHLNWIAKVMQR